MQRNQLPHSTSLAVWIWSTLAVAAFAAPLASAADSTLAPVIEMIDREGEDANDGRLGVVHAARPMQVPSRVAPATRTIEVAPQPSSLPKRAPAPKLKRDLITKPNPVSLKPLQRSAVVVARTKPGMGVPISSDAPRSQVIVNNQLSREARATRNRFADVVPGAASSPAQPQVVEEPSDSSETAQQSRVALEEPPLPVRRKRARWLRPDAEGEVHSESATAEPRQSDADTRQPAARELATPEVTANEPAPIKPAVTDVRKTETPETAAPVVAEPASSPMSSFIRVTPRGEAETEAPAPALREQPKQTLPPVHRIRKQQPPIRTQNPAPVVRPREERPAKTTTLRSPQPAPRELAPVIAPREVQTTETTPEKPAVEEPNSVPLLRRTASRLRMSSDRFARRKPMDKQASHASSGNELTRFLGTIVGPSPTRRSPNSRLPHVPSELPRTTQQSPIPLPTPHRPARGERKPTPAAPRSVPGRPSWRSGAANSRSSNAERPPVIAAAAQFKPRIELSSVIRNEEDAVRFADHEFKSIGELQAEPLVSAGEQLPNPAQLKFQRAGEVLHPMGFCRTGFESFVMWEAPATHHRPLYFEEPNLERHGLSAGVFQPVFSAAHFFGRVPALPYLMAAEGHHQCHYTLGHYRPGSCAPYELYLPPRSFKGLTAESLTVLGMLYLIP